MTAFLTGVRLEDDRQLNQKPSERRMSGQKQNAETQNAETEIETMNYVETV